MKTEFTVDMASSKPVADQMGDGFANPANHTYFDTTYVEAREVVAGVNLKWDFWKGAALQGELIAQQLDNQSAPKNSSVSQVMAWYVMPSWKIRVAPALAVTPYVTFEMLWSWDAEHNPECWFAGDAKWGGQIIDGFTSLLWGVNLNVFTNSYIKLEGAWVNAHMTGVYKNYQKAFDMFGFATQFSLAF